VQETKIVSDRKLLPGKFVWFELMSGDARPAQAFYRRVLGWRTEPFPMGASSYEMIYAGDTMIGGYGAPGSDRAPSRWMSYVSVPDVDETAQAVAPNGGKVLEAPYDVPDVGRMARIADPQGAELSLFRSARGDAADVIPVPAGGWLWNELHTSDPTKALEFYQKVLGFWHRSMDMGPGGMYHILSRGGVDRGGVTSHLPRGASPHWLPYVTVEDVDATIAKARAAGGKIPCEPEDIPGVGRCGVIEDPTGAVLAILKPLPMKGENEGSRVRMGRLPS